MTAYLIKRMVSTPVTNGTSYTTESIKIENVSSASIVTESEVDKFAIVSDGVTSKYNCADYLLSITG